MKKIFVYNLLLLISCNVVRAQSPTSEWISTMGGPLFDAVSAIEVDRTGNIYVTGYFQSESYFQKERVFSRGGSDIFTAKYSSSGALVWARTAGSDYNKQNVISEFGTTITTDLNGNVFVGGTFHRAANFENQVVVSAGKSDLCLAKYSEDGNLLWVRRAGGNSQDVVESITTDVIGNLYVTGYYQNEASFESTNLNGAEFDNFFVAKYSASGELLWVRNGSQSGAAKGIAISVFNNEVFVTGNFENNLLIGDREIISSGSKDIFIAKFSLDGKCSMILPIGGVNVDIVNDLDVTADGIFITGAVGSLDKSSNCNAFVSKFSLDGYKVWTRQIDGREYSNGTAIEVLNKDQVIVIGNFHEELNSDNAKVVGYEFGEAFTIQLDRHGNLDWLKVSKGAMRKEFTDITSFESSIFTTGAIMGNQNIDGFELISEGSSDGIISRIEIRNKIDELRVKESFVVYPNPSHSEFKVEYEFSEAQKFCQIIVTDITGKQVFKRTMGNIRKVDLQISLPNVSKGIYNVEVRSAEIELYKRIVLF